MNDTVPSASESPREASLRCSGRTPQITMSSPLTLAASSEVIGTSTNGIRSVVPSTLAGRKFIGGEPMNPATKRLTGWS